MNRHTRERPGISEVVGALLLIIVVVTAVASLSYFLASAQQNAQNRSVYLTDLKNENLQIVSASLSPQGGPTWNQVVLSVRNANTLTSGLRYILVNGAYITRWYQVSAPGPSGSLVAYLGANSVSLPIPAKATEYIKLNESIGGLSGPLQPTEPLQITLVSESGNYFTTNWSPPTALASATISPEGDQALQQDELSFSGSQSYAGNGTVIGYSWAVSVPSSCPNDYSANATATGENLAYTPEALFPTTSAAPYKCDSVAGPITATLTVTDSNGFTSTSQPLLVPADPSLDPVGSISASITGTTGTPPCSQPSCTVTVTVYDVLGDPVNGAVVNAIPIYGDVKVSPLSATTPCSGSCSAGQVTFSVSFTNGGSMDFETGNLVPAQLSFP
jgi:hypothetical protein